MENFLKELDKAKTFDLEDILGEVLICLGEPALKFLSKLCNLNKKGKYALKMVNFSITNI